MYALIATLVVMNAVIISEKEIEQSAPVQFVNNANFELTDDRWVWAPTTKEVE